MVGLRGVMIVGRVWICMFVCRIVIVSVLLSCKCVMCWWWVVDCLFLFVMVV